MTHPHDYITTRPAPNALLWGVLAGGASGLLFILPGWGVVLFLMLAFFSPLPLMLVGLTAGAMGAAVGALVAFVGLAAFANLAEGLGHLLTVGAPVALLAWRAGMRRETAEGTEWYPAGLMLRDLAFYGLALAVIGLVLMGQAEDSLADQFAAMALSSGMNASVVTVLTQNIIPLGIMSWMLFMAINAAAAFGIAQRSGQGLRPGPRFRQLDLPQWMPVPFGIGLALASFMQGTTAGVAGAVIAALCMVPFFLQGMAVIHVWTARFPLQPLLLGWIYLMLLVFGIFALFVVILGVIEEWARFRARGNEAA